MTRARAVCVIVDGLVVRGLLGGRGCHARVGRHQLIPSNAAVASPGPADGKKQRPQVVFSNFRFSSHRAQITSLRTLAGYVPKAPGISPAASVGCLRGVLIWTDL